jgi:putative intracellular protease/amidase
MIPAWVPGNGHAKALVVIAGENGGTELTDFAIPYGVLKRAGINTLTVSAHEGPLRFRPALRAHPDATMAEFDARHPEGADYVIVPAMVNRADPTVRAWISDQARKGATLVSICDGW